MRRIGLIAIAAAVVLPLSAVAQTSGYYERSYTRMSYVQGDVYVQRVQDLGYEQGQVNLVVVEGDKLGTRSGRLEIQLGLRNYLRLDNDTQVEMAALPDRDGLPTKLHVSAGGVYLRVSTLDVEKGYEIHTPDASFYVLREGLYRVDVRPSRETDFSVYEGAAEAAGQEGSIVIEERQRVSASDGRFVSEPFSLIARRDDFSAWNSTREALFARASSQSASYLPAEYSDYGYELDTYGSWVNEADYGYVWVPRVIDSVWRPYSHGRWVWYPIIGWTWVSYDSWGWCTHHYGRWGWRLGLGWYWIPRNHWAWGPAWVNWWYDGDYIGWCALSYYNRPAVIINNYFYDRHDRNDFRSFGRTLNVVRRDQLQDRNLRSVAVGADRFASRGDGITFRNGLTDVRPSGRGDAAINARAAEVLSGRNARPVEGGYADNGRRLSAGEIRSSGIRGETISGSGSRVLRDGATARSEEPGRASTGRTQDSGAGIVSRSGSSGSAGRAGAGEARTIRSYPSQGDRGVSSGTVRRNDGGASSSTAGRPGVSSGTVRSRETGSGSASGTSVGSASRRSGDESPRAIRAYPSGGAASRSTGAALRSSAGSSPSSSRVSGSSMREYPSGSASRSSGAASSGAARSSSRSTVSSREYPSSSSARSSSSSASARLSNTPRSSSSSPSSRISSAPSTRASSSSSSRISSAPSRSSSSSSRISSAPRSSASSSSSSRLSSTPRSSSSSSSSRISSAPPTRASSSSSSRISSAPSRSSSSSSRISSAPRSSASSSSSRSYSAPARSSSSSSRISSAPRASSSPSRSYSAPSRSSSSSSSARVSSRSSSSGGSSSRSSGSSARSSSSSSSRSSSGSSRRR